MSETFSTLDTSAANAPSVVEPNRNFYVAMSVACALTVLIGFAPTYYLRESFNGPPLSPLLQWHGAIFTAWIALFVAQTTLVRMERRDLHRRLGMLGVALAIAMAWVGYVAAIEGAVAGTAGRRLGVSPLPFLTIPLASILVFVGLVAAALYFRRARETHKRLMLLATISILTPAIARMQLEVLGLKGPILNFAIVDLFVAVCVLYDWLRRGRVHSAYVFGGLALVVSQPLRLVIGQTEAWQSFARWLIA